MAKGILDVGKSLLQTATFGILGNAILGNGKKAAAPAPAATTARVMPIADDAAVMRARKRSITAQMQRGGRGSTILTGSTETLGG